MSAISGLPRDGSYTIIHLPPQPEEREVSQKSITDEKIGKLKCEICFNHENPEELQTIPHKSYLQNTIATQRKCRANEEPLFCRKCVVQLTIPKKCPMCRDTLNIPSENVPIAFQPQPGAAQQPQLVVNIQIHNHVQIQQENRFDDECPIGDNCRYFWRELGVFWSGALVIVAVLTIGGITALVITLPRH